MVMQRAQVALEMLIIFIVIDSYFKRPIVMGHE